MFDLDGTLADTSAGILDSLRYTIEKMKLPNIKEEDMTSFIGPPLLDSFKKRFEMEENEAYNAIRIFREYYGFEGLYNVKLYAGISMMLHALKNKPYLIGVATYKKEDLAVRVLEYLGIAKYFDVIHGADSEEKLKKHEIIEKCINELNLNRAHCLYVGDTENDAKAASFLRVPFVGVTWGFGYKRTHMNDSEIYLINEPMELLSSKQE